MTHKGDLLCIYGPGTSQSYRLFTILVLTMETMFLIIY